MSIQKINAAQTTESNSNSSFNNSIIFTIFKMIVLTSDDEIRVNMKLIMTALVVFGCIGLLPTANALEDDHMYLAIDIGQADGTTICDGLPTTFVCTQKTGYYNIGLGYQISNQLSFEMGYFRSRFSVGGITTINSVPVSVLGDVIYSGFKFAGVGMLPVSDNVSFIGTIGLASIKDSASLTFSDGSTSVTVSDNYVNNNFYYGVGLKFDINRQFSIRAMYQDFGKVKSSETSTSDAFNVINIGLNVGF